MKQRYKLEDLDGHWAVFDTVDKNYRPHTTREKANRCAARLEAQHSGLSLEVELADLPGLGFVQVTSVGDENMYFTLTDGTPCFCKVG